MQQQEDDIQIVKTLNGDTAAFAGLIEKYQNMAYTLAYNILLNRGKKKKLPTIALEDLNSKAYISFPSEDALAAYHLQDQQRFIQEAMQLLREDERLVITLYYLNELSTTEVAKVTHFSLSNVKVLLHRGRQRLAESIAYILRKEAKSIL